MNIRKRSPALLIGLIIGALLLVGGGVFAWQRSRDATTIDDQVPETVQEIGKDTDNPATPEKDTNIPAKQPDPKDPETTTPTSSALKVEITSASFDPDTAKAVVRALVEGTSKGSCTATFKKGSKTVSQTSSVEVVTSYAACGKMDVARSRFPSSGTWSVTVTLTSGGTSVTSPSETITI